MGAGVGGAAETAVAPRATQTVEKIVKESKPELLTDDGYDDVDDEEILTRVCAIREAALAAAALKVRST